MKKLFCIITLVTLLLGCLTLSAAAEHDYAAFGLTTPSGMPTLSEDMQVLSLKGHTYRRIDLTKFILNIGGGVNGASLELSDTQKGVIKQGLVYWDMEQTVAKVVLELEAGAEMTLYFVNDNYRSQAEALLSGENIDVQINFYWPTEYELITPLSDLQGTPITVHNDFVRESNTFNVFAHVDPLSISYQKGILLDNRGTLYYLDFEANGMLSSNYYVGKDIYVMIYEITNEDLKVELSKCIQEYYDDGVGVFYDDNFTEQLSTGILIFLFIGVPGLILVCAVVLLIKSKGYQRKNWIVTAVLSVCTVAVFAIVTVLIMRI